MLYEDRDLAPDRQDASGRGSDTIYKAIAVGAIGALGYGAYRQGYLKDIISPMLKMADKVAKDGSERAGASMSAIKEWSRLKHLAPYQITNATKEVYSAPLNSIFRNTGDSFGYTLLKELKESLSTGKIDFYNVKKALRDTTDDLAILHKMIDKNVENIPKLRKGLSDTNLYKTLNEYQKASNIIEETMSGQRGAFAFKSKWMNEMLSSLTMTDEMAAEEIKKAGFAKVRLKDILEQDANHNFKLKEGFEKYFDPSSYGTKGETSLIEKIRSTLSLQRIDENGKRLSGAMYTDEWQNLIIDSAIRINEKGEVIDYRMTKNQLIGFQRSLASDFKIPLVGFNPFQMAHWDQAGRRKPFGGIISPDQFAPSFTGRTGRYRIGDYVGDVLGDEFKDSPLMVINNKAYGLKLNDKGNPILHEFEGRFNLYDISHADSYMSLKPTVNAQRQMANLSLSAEAKIPWAQYKEKLIEKGITSPTKLKIYEAKYKMGQMLDLGYQERWLKEEASKDRFHLDDISIDEWTDNFINKVTENKVFWTNGFEYDTYNDLVEARAKYNFKDVLGEGFEPFVSGDKTVAPNMYFMSKQGISIRDIIDTVKEDRWKGLDTAGDYIKQFFAGRDMINPEFMTKNFNERSTYTWTVLNKLSEGIGSSSSMLGLSVESKGSTGALLGNLLLKRALPVYVALQIPGIINWMSEPFFGQNEDGSYDNISKALMRGPVKRIDLAAHKFLDFTKATDVFKELGELVPGSDQLNEDVPFIYAMGLGQTEEERKEYIENGYDPVRKGRFWGSGSIPWSGSKILYWRPNLYRRIEADVQFSDSKWGSRQEYYENAWFPNPVNPLAPIKHFVTDKYHYEEKHYYDRPYLMTSAEGENIPVIGPLFSQTAGRLLKPQRRMHPEYWQGSLSVTPEDEKASTLITEGKGYYDNGMMSYDYNVINNRVAEQVKANEEQSFLDTSNAKQSMNRSNDAQLYEEMRYNSIYNARRMVKKQMVTPQGTQFTRRVFFGDEGYTAPLPATNPVMEGTYGRITPEYTGEKPGVSTSILPTRTYDRYGHPYEAYITPSGGISIVDVPDEMNLYNVNKDLTRWSINKVMGTDQRVHTIDMYQGGDIPIHDQDISNAFLTNAVGEEWNTLTDVAGLRGFMVRNYLTGSANTNATQIENQAYAYSVKKGFWDQNLGGFGGNLSEISRRFMVKRNKDIDYINPVRNTMPAWMPGSNYFTDFKHGDPYSKIENGEERLPGEGYERLHNINISTMGIGSSYLGYSKEDIVKHLIGQEGYMSSFEQDTLNKGTKIHAQIEAAWKQAGFAISTEGKIEDKQNNIIGYYDAMIRDQTSPTGIGIVDIKTTSAKKLDQIRKSGTPLEHHQKQVNYYLWATGNTKSKGYVYYVDKENLDNSYMVGFDFSRKLLDESLNNLYSARATVREGIQRGIIGRGDMYSPLEKVRILADVAPYSQEYKDALAEVAQSNPDAETKRELSAIHQRVIQQKEPLRVYDYKFSTSNVVSEDVTVKKILDNNTILVDSYGKEHTVKFAGIHVSESNTDLYKKTASGKEISMNEAAQDVINKYLAPGSKVTISYDADERNKFSKDSTSSIRAAITSRGTNVNRKLLDMQLATEKDDDSPAAVHARYSKGEIAFGSAMERVTHTIGGTPFINKIIQVRSPYEQYRNKEVYGKDFQSWNNPISGILIPNLEKDIANQHAMGIAGVAAATYIGTLFGRTKFGKIVGGTVAFSAVMAGKGIMAMGSDSERDWRPLRRRKQEEMNEYIDALKYIKNIRLYGEYKEKAMRENGFDVDKYVASKEAKGSENKAKRKELEDFKKTVKVDFKHRKRYNFKYGKPKYVDMESGYKQIIHDVNKEIAELQSERKVEKLPLNAIKALEYRDAAKKTMWGYEPGDSIADMMSALPKKDRQYFKHFMNAPEEEKEKILRIAPSYMRRALQSTWGMKVDEKPALADYFTEHALPNPEWIGWREDVNMDDVKVKLVHLNKLDPGEFDIWDDTKKQADQVNIPIPNIHMHSTRAQSQKALNDVLRNAGMEDIQLSFVNSRHPSAVLNISSDPRTDVEKRMDRMDIA